MARTADRNIALTCLGSANTLYLIQATTNLASPVWTTIGASSADGQGWFNFTDLSATNYSCRFYRTSTP
jgi:hypothetical protein